MSGAGQGASVRVFISYARVDGEFVERLKRDLRESGATIWIDHESLPVGHPDWQAAIRRGIAAASGFIYVGSPHAADSKNVGAEVQIAEEDERAGASLNIIPLWARGDQWSKCAPFELMRANYLDARGGKYPASLGSLLLLLGLTAPPAAAGQAVPLSATLLAAPAPMPHAEPETALESEAAREPLPPQTRAASLEGETTLAEFSEESPARSAERRQASALIQALDIGDKPSPERSVTPRSRISIIPRISRAGRHPWLTPLMIGVAAVLVVSISAVALASLTSGALTLFGPSGPEQTATASAIAFRSAFFTTQTAQLTQDYHAPGIGPCDTTDPPYNETHSYWDWTADVRCAGGGVARMYAGGALKFYGKPAGFPSAYEVSVTFTFLSTSDNMCVYLSVARTVISPSGSITLCKDGGWADARGKHTGTPATSYMVSVTVTPTATAISVNGELRVPSDNADGQTYNIYIAVSPGPASDILDVSNFFLHPSS